MGIIKGGILGGFSNKTGAVIGAYWRTLNVMRGLPRKSSKAATQLQLDQQAKFTLAVATPSNVASDASSRLPLLKLTDG